MAETLGSSAPPNKPKLFDQVREVIRRKHYSIRTEQAYCDWIKRFILFHRMSRLQRKIKRSARARDYSRARRVLWSPAAETAATTV